MLDLKAIQALKDRYENEMSAKTLNDVIAFAQTEFNNNKAIYVTAFEAVHHTNTAVIRLLGAKVSQSFAIHFGKSISHSVISAMGENIDQIYQDCREAKAKQVEETLIKAFNWSRVNDVMTYIECGTEFKLKWDDSMTNVQLFVGDKKVFGMKVSGYNHNTVATRIDNCVYDEVA